MKVLLIAAHPDDELLGVGGTIAWHVARGDRVKVAVMCEGISARFSHEGRYEVGRNNGTIAGAPAAVRAGVAEARSENGDSSDLPLRLEARPRRYVPERFDEVRQEIRAAARILGATDLHVGNLP